MASHQKELIALRTGEKPAERSGEYWSQEEAQQAERLFLNGTGLSEIALELGRNEVAICQQLIKMGLLARQCRPRLKKKKLSHAECLCPFCSVKTCSNCGKEAPNV